MTLREILIRLATDAFQLSLEFGVVDEMTVRRKTVSMLEVTLARLEERRVKA